MKSQHDFKAFPLRDRTNVQHLASIRKSRIISNILAYLKIAFFFGVNFLFSVPAYLPLNITRYSYGSSEVIFRVFFGVIRPIRAKQNTKEENTKKIKRLPTAFKVASEDHSQISKQTSDVPADQTTDFS